MNNLSSKFILQSLELMEQNFLGQIKAIRGIVLSESESFQQALPVKAEQKAVETKINDELAKYFESIEGAEFRGAADERDVSESEKPDQ